MSEFQTYLILGFQHIADLAGYDHILFICALCVVYQYQEWKKIALQITAFTIGHSITLALSVSNILFIDSKYIEILIPITIVATAIANLVQKTEGFSNRNYGLTIFFGFIHGMGFSYLLKMLIGNESDIFMPLLAFNLGIEIGQLIIISFFTFLTIIVSFLGIRFQYWKIGISLLIMLMAFYLLWQKLAAL